MTFTVPNWISRYRAETFATKEPETLEWVERLPEAAVLWDVGANVGTYAIYAAKARRCRVFAFEPSVFNLELLARNVFANGLQDLITIVPFPLSGSPGVNKFSMSTTALGGALSAFGGADSNGEPFQSTFEYSVVGVTMDQAVGLPGIPYPDFIKMDVDGLEHLILQGGPAVLRHTTGILVEIDDSYAEQRDTSAACLTSAGLSLRRKCDLGSPTMFNQWWERGE